MRKTQDLPLPSWKLSCFGTIGSLLLLSLAAPSMASPTDVATKAFSEIAEVLSSVNLRTGAGKSARAMAVLPKGEQVQVLNQANGWTQIRRTGPHQSQEGWVSTPHLRLASATQQPAATPQPQAPVELLAAPQTKKNAQDKENITLNFVNADIQSVIKTVGMITGKNFILDPRITGNFNIVSENPISRDLVYPILLSALRLHGYAAVEEKGFTKIVPEADAKLNFSMTETVGTKGAGDKIASISGDKIITQVYPLQHESAAQLLPVLRPLITPNNVIAVYPNSNTLVITDYAENVKRINKIISSIDVPSQSEMHVMKLQYASAIDTSQMLMHLLPEATPIAGSTPKLSIAVDTHSNSLIVRADNPSYLTRIRAMLKDLDTPAAAGGDIHVVYLRNADATKMAETLRGLLAADAAKNSPMPAPALANAAATPASLIATVSSSASPAAPTSTIQAYASTNSLVIVAPDNVYNSLRTVIDQLDARRAQVYIEALVVEVTGNTSGEFGIQWQDLTGANANEAQVVGGTNFRTTKGSNIIDAATNISGIGAGLNIGVVRGQLTLPGVNGKILNLGFLARALESNGNANILSTPSLLTLDNEDAKIVVGQNVPFITGSFAQAAGVSGAAVNPFQTIERKDVGLTLRVRPQVAEGGSIKLGIYQEVSSVDQTSLTSSSGVTTNKRSLESTVLVDDGQIVVLGGLVQDNVQAVQDKVPLLGDIPVLGNLFRYESRTRTKTNLMVFLRPVVLRDAQASASLTGDRYEYIRNEQAQTQSGSHLLLPDLNAPKLPPLQLDLRNKPGTTPKAQPSTAP